MKTLALLGLLCLPAFAAAETWTVAASTLTYTLSHPLHGAKGTSHDSRGKAVCRDGGCSFLAAAPVNSFLSGDRNRDLHMIEVVKGAEFPMVTVSGELPGPSTGTFSADIEVQFAGQTAAYKAVAFTVDERSDGRIAFHGVVPATLADFKIVPPSLLGVPVKNEIPVEVRLLWVKSPI